MQFNIATASESDGRWIAEVLEVPGALAYGTTKARRVFAALLRIGWRVKRETGGSHNRMLARDGFPD